MIGGTGALCSRMAEALAGAGARTVVVGRDPEKGITVAERLAGRGHDVEFEACDAAVRDELRALVERVLGSHGRIDVLVNGAGANSATPFLEISDEELERLVAVNQLAVVRSCQEFGRYFVERAGLDRRRREHRQRRQRVGPHPAVAGVHVLDDEGGRPQPDPQPGARVGPPRDPLQHARARVSSPQSRTGRSSRPSGCAPLIEHTPLGRFGEADELMGATLLLASDAGRFITGTELVVDGGFGAMTI